MTWDTAYAAFAEDELGSLGSGKKADSVVLDRDIMDESERGEFLKAELKGAGDKRVSCVRQPVTVE